MMIWNLKLCRQCQSELQPLEYQESVISDDDDDVISFELITIWMIWDLLLAIISHGSNSYINYNNICSNSNNNNNKLLEDIQVECEWFVMAGMVGNHKPNVNCYHHRQHMLLV